MPLLPKSHKIRPRTEVSTYGDEISMEVWMTGFNFQRRWVERAEGTAALQDFIIRFDQGKYPKLNIRNYLR